MDQQCLPWAWEGRIQLCAGHLHIMNHSTTDVLGGIVPCWLGRPSCVHCGVFSSVPGLQPLVASSTNPPSLLSSDDQNCL